MVGAEVTLTPRAAVSTEGELLDSVEARLLAAVSLVLSWKLMTSEPEVTLMMQSSKGIPKASASL